ncbi:bifunctional metallophosphatase/5'-nucleotidase [Halostella pelagica]|uniref:bifunctional metallophosphatase/5'-nucleotidase n=1 Tax=Halostella pelagica TaxID=2583824 RepID=UPI0010803166|nr:5'-nucleotidase C-terminal domain-containing protein [Halostella pelagica]
MSLRLLHYSDLETAIDDPEQCARLVGAINSLRDGNSVVIGTGDNTAPGALSLATQGRAALDFFRAVSPHIDTFGNHDFDFGHETARELAAAAPQRWLCANAVRNGDRFAADATAPSTLVETDDYRVGVVGVAHPETDGINPAADGVDFTDPVPAVREEAAALRDRGVDVVVVASHCGKRDDRIARETDVDVVLGGHVHDVHVETVADTFVVRPGRAGTHFSEVTLNATPDVTIHSVDGTDRDDDLAATLRDRLAEHGLDEVVATVETPVELTEETVNAAESRAGNFVADALRWSADADVAISPAGALRADGPLDGDVTVAELVNLTPYEDDLAVLSLSGERLRDALDEIPIGYHYDDFPLHYCSHVSGARIVWDDDEGELTDATVGGHPLDSDRRYTLAVADYLVETDHVSDAFDEEDVVRRCGLARDAIVEYAREEGINPDIEGRIDRPTLSGRRSDR